MEDSGRESWESKSVVCCLSSFCVYLASKRAKSKHDGTASPIYGQRQLRDVFLLVVDRKGKMVRGSNLHLFIFSPSLLDGLVNRDLL